MAEIRVPLSRAALVVTIDSDEDDPVVGVLMRALRDHATVTVSGVSVTFPGRLQDLWDVALRGGEVTITFTNTVDAEDVVPGGRELIEEFIVEGDDGSVFLDLEMADRKAKVLAQLVAALGGSNPIQTGAALRALANLTTEYHEMLRTGDHLNLTKLAALMADETFKEALFDTRNIGATRVGLLGVLVAAPVFQRTIGR